MDKYSDIERLRLKKWIKRPPDPAPHIKLYCWDHRDAEVEFIIGKKEDK